MSFFKFRETSIPVSSSYLLLLGFAVLIFGMYCNFVVVMSNGGLMPVWRYQIYSSDTHYTIVDIDDINYLYLADIYPIGNNVYSIGDFLLKGGMIMLILGFLIIIYNSLLSIPCFGGCR